MKQTAIYYNPERDTVYIVDYVREMDHLLHRHNEETIRSIKVLAMGGRPVGDLLRVTQNAIGRFEGLERLIFVVEGESARDEDESIRENVEGILIKTGGRLILEGNRKERKLPMVKVMGALAFESFA
jgi:hypothetical protein